MLNFLETYDCDGSGTADLTKRPFVSGLTRYVTPYEDCSYGHLSHGQGAIATELLITPSGDGSQADPLVLQEDIGLQEFDDKMRSDGPGERPMKSSSSLHRRPPAPPMILNSRKNNLPTPSPIVARTPAEQQDNQEEVARNLAVTRLARQLRRHESEDSSYAEQLLQQTRANAASGGGGAKSYFSFLNSYKKEPSPSDAEQQWKHLLLKPPIGAGALSMSSGPLREMSSENLNGSCSKSSRPGSRGGSRAPSITSRRGEVAFSTSSRGPDGYSSTNPSALPTPIDGGPEQVDSKKSTPVENFVNFLYRPVLRYSATGEPSGDSDADRLPSKNVSEDDLVAGALATCTIFCDDAAVVADQKLREARTAENAGLSPLRAKGPMSSLASPTGSGEGGSTSRADLDSARSRIISSLGKAKQELKSLPGSRTTTPTSTTEASAGSSSSLNTISTSSSIVAPPAQVLHGSGSGGNRRSRGKRNPERESSTRDGRKKSKSGKIASSEAQDKSGSTSLATDVGVSDQADAMIFHDAVEERDALSAVGSCLTLKRMVCIGSRLALKGVAYSLVAYHGLQFVVNSIVDAEFGGLGSDATDNTAQLL